MIFMGVGGDWYPHAPKIDALLSNRLAIRGFLGTREAGKCLFGSASKDQALQYTRDGSDDDLRVLRPERDAVISWVPNMTDMILEFERHLGNLRYGSGCFYNGVKFATLAKDIAGDIGIAETYLRLNRQRRALAAMADSFLDQYELEERRLGDDDDVTALLDGHIGEVWITGPCRVVKYEPGIELHSNSRVLGQV